jgi:hypothetical protein
MEVQLLSGAPYFMNKYRFDWKFTDEFVKDYQQKNKPTRDPNNVDRSTILYAESLEEAQSDWKK